MGSAQRFSSVASKIGSVGVHEGLAAYGEAGMDSMLTYVVEGHRVSAGGLLQALGVPAVSNALVPGRCRRAGMLLVAYG